MTRDNWVVIFEYENFKNHSLVITKKLKCLILYGKMCALEYW